MTSEKFYKIIVIVLSLLIFGVFTLVSFFLEARDVGLYVIGLFLGLCWTLSFKKWIELRDDDE